jgi:apolipoprotein N-acyltransferase
MIFSLILSAAGGLILSVAFPTLNLDLLAWLAFIPLLAALERERFLPRAAICGFFFGLAFFAVDLRWIIQTMVIHGKFHPFTATLIFVSMICALALLPALFSVVCVFLDNRGFNLLLVAPVAWSSLEYIRTYVFTGFPWDLVAYSQAHRLALTQICDLTGVYGLSFLIVMVNVGLFSFMKFVVDRDWKRLSRLLIAFGCLGMVLIYGTVRLGDFPKNQVVADTVSAGILQGDISQDIKWDPLSRSQTFVRYESLAQDAVKRGADLLIWPETSVPVVIGGSDPSWKYATHISKVLKVPMLIGAPYETHTHDNVNFFNSAFLVENGELTERYDKIHLVPFGEYMPLSWMLPLGPGLAAREADYSAGSVVTIMKPGRFPPFGVLICYEAIFPYIARSAVLSGAEALVNITNDGWFGNSAAPYQHLVMAGFRAIENRVWLFRAANTGVSAVYDRAGRLVASLPLMEQGALVRRIPARPQAGSFYTRYSDIFAWTVMGLLAIMLLFGFVIFRPLAKGPK